MWYLALVVLVCAGLFVFSGVFILNSYHDCTCGAEKAKIYHTVGTVLKYTTLLEQF
jgi:hypothetical protein